MPPAPQKRLHDGILDFSGGIDSGKSPTMALEMNPNGLRRNQISFATNATMRGGRLQPRPGFTKLTLPDFGQKQGRFQGAFFYQPDDNQDGCIVASIDGHFLRFDVANANSIADLTPVNDPNPSVRKQAWFYQAENFLVGQDGQSKPFIYDGGNSRRANTDEVPTGTVGAYSKGRIWQCRPNGTTFVAGDLVYSTTGGRSDVLKFTENTFLNGGGFFGVPENAGEIRFMRPIANIDTSLGQGPLLVGTDNLIFSLDAPIDRTQWQNLSYPLSVVSMITYGGCSQNSAVLINGDLFYRSLDGVRSFVVARRNFGQWANTPISREMNRVIENDSRYLLYYSSAVIFDNRLLMTSSPVDSSNGVYHRSLMALDFDLISGMAYKSPPAWEGIWNATGLNVLQLLVGKIRGKERCFAFSLSTANEIELWEITASNKFDFLPDETRITWSFEGGSYPFDNPFGLKRLETGDIWIDKVIGEIDFTLQYRPDQYPCWRDWDSWQECAKKEDCDTPECGTPKEFKMQYRARKRFVRASEEDCDSLTKKLYCDGYEFQPRLTVQGYCEIKQLRLQALQRIESPTGECSE